jgi:ribonuclease HI
MDREELRLRTDKPQVTIYTDGACLRNPGPGGYGVVVLLSDGQRRELSGGFRLTTNNRMEILAAIEGLKLLKQPSKVLLYSDSQYLVNAMQQGWAKRWQANGWMRGKGQPAINPDLWKQLLALCEQHEVTFSWVRGHAGNAENERCDRLSVQAAKGRNLPIDTGYEQAIVPRPSLFDAL